MKLCQVLYSGLGGHANVAFSLADEAGSRSDRPHAMVFVGVEPVLSDYVRRCNDLGAEHLHVRTRQGMALAAWPSVFRALSRQRPEAIVLHSVKLIIPCALYARLHRIPLVAVEHQANDLKGRHEWWVSRLLMRHADAVVVLTPTYRAALQAGLGRHWRPEKVRTIPNGIDISRLVAPAPDLGRRPCRIGMAARMTSIKRQDLLIDALSLLVARDGPGRWQLSLAGDGDALTSLREQAGASGLGDAVEFAGLLGEDALVDWFSSLDIYAHASEGETLSTSLLQAMATGLPIVGSDVTGISDLLEGGVGLCVDQSADAFAQGFDVIAREPDRAATFGRRAREKVSEAYSQSAMFEAYRDLLESLCRK